MDAVKFLKEKKRMSEQFVECQPCPIYAKRSEPQYESYSCDQFINRYPKSVVSIVEQWSKEHPIMTNKMKFEEVFGRTCVENGELVLVRPSWWMEEYHEPKGDEEE